MIPVIDFGSQYTRLICRKIRELGVNSRIYPAGADISADREDIYGIILSGSPSSVSDKKAFSSYRGVFDSSVPVLGICYGMQFIVNKMGGVVERGDTGEYGTSRVKIKEKSLLFDGIKDEMQAWASHCESVEKLPSGFRIIASTEDIEAAAIENSQKKLYGVQFHPEVAHTPEGINILKNFLFKICRAPNDWSLGNWIDDTIKDIREKAGEGNVIMALSGGVDSSVASILVSRAVGERFFPIFVDHGLMRRKDIRRIKKVFIEDMDMDVKMMDCRRQFFEKLKGVSDPEEKRKIIGREFINSFTEGVKKIKGITHLAQGTIFPDVIESAASGNGAAKIKSHHNVGGLPQTLGLELIEPLKLLYKDEVREIGIKLGLPKELIRQHPFPGPGLAVRILGPVSSRKAEILRKADEILDEELKKQGVYYNLWQAFCVLLPVRTVGVMGDARTYDNAIALRCVKSVDAMTASWAELEYKLLGRISTRIVNSVEGVNRVVYDITNKPPGTIEWE
ncbi:MAG: glutamine-hydrolyzing GMP synthase [Elusimicrobiota bacterium]